MIPLTLAEVARATGGRLVDGADAGASVSGPVVIDSRRVAPGALFVALPGERVDGHDFADRAAAAGAVATLAGRPVGTPAVVVDDPVTALGRLARAVRDRLPQLTVVGITGSSGKTSTKDLLGQVLAEQAPTVAPQSSFNNEIGVPLTLLRCDGDTRFLVSEMGARTIGNVAYLCGLVLPRIAVVLNVGAAHAGVFGSRAATAAAKGELVEALPDDGVAVLNADDPLVAAMARRTTARTIMVGRAEDADLRAADVRLDDAARASFTLVSTLAGAERRVEVGLQVHGEHHVANALAVAAVALCCGMGLDQVGAALSRAQLGSTGRMEVRTRGDGVVVVDDSYNANPDSVAAALRALVSMRPPAGPEPRRWAVLGEMLELGPDSPREHERIGALALELGVDHVLAVGPGATAYRAATWAEGVEQAAALLDSALRPDDIVLVKASRAVGLDRLVRAVLESGPATGQDDAHTGAGPRTGTDTGTGTGNDTGTGTGNEPGEIVA